ncbi:MAG: ATP synthase F1 subunit epsilon [Candidatus Nomurabacteria bacterium]|nr:MAG: ATP synthase F1 subunit epsilon [Candidatus Nomurabacteria bacterium]
MAQNTLKLKIISPEALVYESDDVLSINMKTGAGEITVLPKHIPLITTLKTGEIIVKKTGEKEPVGLSVSRGVLEVREDSKVIILAERSELGHMIDVERAEAAYERAKQIKEESLHTLDVDSARFEALIEKELNRIRVGKKWKR